MNILRKLVSGKKNRYEEDGYNLDLTYITPRIIAMSLPGEGVTKIYRNSINAVSKLLNEKHHGNYRIFNLSGIKYDYTKFGSNVKEYPWQDHYPPPIEVLFNACNDIHQWLYLDINNIIAVNCRAGKGRTGSLICCYLLYSGRFNDAKNALNYYKHKRFSTGGGVTQPSQIRYVEYFSQILYGIVRSPNILQLHCIHIKTAPHMSNSSCKLVFEIKQNNRLLFSNKKASRDKQQIFSDDWSESRIHQLALINSDLFLQGDIHCFLTHWGTLKMKKVCRFSFSTAFIEPGTSFVLQKDQLDPDSFIKSTQVSNEFCVIMEFRNKICECNNRMTILERCEFCSKYLESDEKERWEDIQRNILERVRSDPSINLFGLEKDDIEEELCKNLVECVCSSEGSND